MDKTPPFHDTKTGTVIKVIVIEKKHTWKEIQKSTGLSERELNYHFHLLFDEGMLVKDKGEYFIVPKLEEQYLNYYKPTTEYISRSPDTIKPTQKAQMSLTKIKFSRHIGLLIAILMIGSVGYNIYNVSQISSLKSKNQLLLFSLNESETRISGLEDELNTRNVTLSQLSNEKNQLQFQVTSLQSQLSEIESSKITVIDVSFSRIEYTSLILQKLISDANESIHVMVMVITQNELADALIEAHNRGIEVTVIIDDYYENTSGSDFTKIKDAGIDIRTDSRPDLMHHKVMIVDDKIVVIGSYNWSTSAEDSNDENIIIIESEAIADEYLIEFNRLLNQTTSEPEPTPPPSPPTYDGPFWASKNSNIYHKPSCYWAKQIASDNLIVFNTRAQAEAAGYRPCKVCKP